IERLQIPAYDWWNEALHGVARAGQATVFPQAIGLAATFDEQLMLKVANVISDEGRAKHHYFVKNGNRDIYTGLTFWSPNINIFRDPRWGRGQETYGEDPFLTGRMAVNFVNGLQGNDPKYLKTVATIKHYAVHSGPEFTRHSDNFDVSNKDLMETYLSAFEMTVRETNVKSVMCAYNRFRDKPCCGSDLLLHQLLRDRFGFDGYIVSDCGAISDFHEEKAHNYVETKPEAAAEGVKAGTDIECGRVYTTLMKAIEDGLVSIDEIDKSLKRLFRTRFQLGMFDPDSMVKYASIPYDVVGSKEHLDLTLETAKQSLVLLKNDGILPLKKETKIAVIGPNANYRDVLLGNYFGQPIHPVTVLEGISNSTSAENISYAVGCPIVPGMFTNHIVVPTSLFFHEEKGEQKPGLVASYFENSAMKGEPVHIGIEANINKIYEVSPVDQKIGGEFSVKWEGVLIPDQTGKYDFDGVSVTINGEKPPEEGVTLQKGKSYTIEASISFRKAWYANVIRPTAKLAWTRVDLEYQKDALEAANASDVIIFCGGISPNLEGEEMPIEVEGFSHGDRTNIKLPAIQEELLKKLKATGKPIVYINFSGSAIALNWEDENLPAIVQAFYPGEAAGTAI
ncbi:MAG: glycoside hydrolase family 3 C-terminal domain-containing protein, partial [Cyclobacteriaceae bacterium]|nr:glycoside hydrolase family 3 C-terminal domain-containing protein [Cyclobacteriaceae bacterium]